MLPATLSAGDGDKTESWSPPAVFYSLSVIGRTIEHDGQQMRCFTADEGRQVLLPMFSDYQALFRAAWIWEAQKAEYEATISEIETGIKHQKGVIAYYQDDAEHWREVAKERVKQLESSKKLDWVPWTLVVVESLAFGAFGVWSAAK